MSDPFIPWIPGGPPAPGDEFYGVDRSPSATPRPTLDPDAVVDELLLTGVERRLLASLLRACKDPLAAKILARLPGAMAEEGLDG